VVVIVVGPVQLEISQELHGSHTSRLVPAGQGTLDSLTDRGVVELVTQVLTQTLALTVG
jgi:hypothetical protein